jgi:UDP-glucuronate decarboxylase
VRRPLPQDDPKRRQPVIDRAFDLLGWRPSIELEKGLRRTIDYFALKLSMRPEKDAEAHKVKPSPRGISVGA